MQKDKKGGKRIQKILALILDQFQDPYYQGASPQLAFFLFLSVVPIVVLVSQLLGIFSLSIDDIQAWAGIEITGSNLDLLESIIEYKPSSGINIILIIMAVWAGSRVQFSLSRISNYTFTDGLKTGKGWLPDRMRSIILTVIVILSLVISLTLMIYFPFFVKVILGMNKASIVLNSVWMIIRWPVVFAIYLLMISYVFYLAPSSRVPYKNILPGSIFTAIGFMLATGLFNIYTSLATQNSLLYGAISSAVVLMLWFWVIAWVLLLGITVNRVWWATSTKHPIPLDKRVYDRRMPFLIKGMQDFVNKYSDKEKL